jgi:hypothetical protein
MGSLPLGYKYRPKAPQWLRPVKHLEIDREENTAFCQIKNRVTGSKQKQNQFVYIGLEPFLTFRVYGFWAVYADLQFMQICG